MSFVFNDQAVQLARDLNRLYRNNAPVITVNPGDGPLRAEDVINPRHELGPLNSPLVLAVMAAKDPFEGLSLAASVRMMPQAREQNIIGAIVKLVGEVSQHEYVQEACDTAVRQEFAPTIIRDLRSRAVTRIDNVRQQALAALVEKVRFLSDSVVVEDDFIDRMFTLAFRCDLRTDTFRDMLVKILLSNKIRARVKLMVIDRLHLLPIQLRLELVTKINALADGTESAYIKREIEFTLKERGLSAPTLFAQPSRPSQQAMLPAPPAKLLSGSRGSVPWHEVLLRDKYSSIAAHG